MMGAGKTFIGEKLSKLLAQFVYVDTDAEIKKNTGLSIPEIFNKFSEACFRELERELIEKISINRNQIISIGGGAFENSKNIEALKKNSLVFYLMAPAKELFNRIKDSDNRPLLNDDFSQQTIEKLLKKREKNYYKADFVINTYNKPAYTIIDDILSEYENYVKQRALS